MTQTLNQLRARARHLFNTQPMKSSDFVLSHIYPSNCLGSALAVHGISNFEAPDYVPLTFKSCLFNSDLFDETLKPGSIAFYTFNFRGVQNLHSFVVLNIFGPRSFFWLS